MHFYEVAPQYGALKQQSTLTYQSPELLPRGSIVRITIRNRAVNGIVDRKVSKPDYDTKPIQQVLYFGAVPEPLINLAHWMSRYYASNLATVVQTILPAGLHKTRRGTYSPKPMPTRDQTHRLNKNQREALKVLKSHSQKTVLLHGVTGSGKTRIYIERAKQVFDQGKGVIILVPEIGLTSQVVADFREIFEKDIFVLHSQQTESQRHQQWQAIAEHERPVVIGPRSAVFAPIHKLGLIVVDEEHETAYKQDLSPKYSAVRVASKLAGLHKAQLVLGSATPRIEDRYLAEQKHSPIIRIKQPIKDFQLGSSEVTIVDLKKRDIYGSRSRLFSRIMVEHIELALDNDQQILLFHNRRGTATNVVCTNCGWVALCPNCHLPMTFHRDRNQLRCHVCGQRSSAPHACPECSEPALLYRGVGTKHIVDEARKLFTGAQIARFDSDSAKHERLSERYDELSQGAIQIIIGTQSIAKGLDLPKLDYVGVVLADTSLYVPDYSANERAFQLLYQVVGRTGRHRPGVVDIQTYTPEHPAVTAAVNRDYESFYAQEIKERQTLKYPPFRFLLQLTVERAKSPAAISACEKLAKTIKAKFPNVEVLGPTPAFHERTQKGYRWQLVIKSKRRESLVEIVNNELPSNWHFELDPINLL